MVHTNWNEWTTSKCTPPPLSVWKVTLPFVPSIRNSEIFCQKVGTLYVENPSYKNVLSYWQSVAVFINIHHFINHPAKDKISKACTKDHSKTQPHIVRHKDQHEEITDSNLHNMEKGLKEMMPVEYARAEINNNNTWCV